MIDQRKSNADAAQIKFMKFIVAYEDYTEFNQFEGSWDERTIEFSGKNAERKARDWIAKAKKSHDIKRIRLTQEIPI